MQWNPGLYSTHLPGFHFVSSGLQFGGRDEYLMLSRLSEQDYLRGELSSEIRHEYVDGEVYAMAGAGEAHNLIALNIASKLREFVRGGPCRVFISDMKLHVKTWKAYYYPDVMVTCDPADSQSYFKEQPSLVVEVLSPGTESTDRREKMLAYRTLSSLREYVLIAADKRQVEIYRRDENDEWQLAVTNDGEFLSLESVACRLTLDEIYEDVRLDAPSVK
jgi:Uma2 family endonuclease